MMPSRLRSAASKQGSWTALRRSVRNVRSVLRNPPLATPGHYYSPLTTEADGVRALSWIEDERAPVGIDIDLGETALLAEQLAPMWQDLAQDERYRCDTMYGLADAAVYHSMLRHFRPTQVLEVGSGFSTAVALDTIDAFDLDCRLTCVEPNTGRLEALVRPSDDVVVIRGMVQEVPLETFDVLGDGDFLFIDSTHVVKAGSDVVWTTLRVLPRMKAGVIVHIHDMFWPLEYQDKWLLQRRDWNEIYLIHAFLSGNADWKALLFNDEVWANHPDLVRNALPEAIGSRPGGLWLEKVR
jgi:hypothetical protein